MTVLTDNVVVCINLKWKQVDCTTTYIQ